MNVNDNKETVEVDMTDEQFMKIAMMAHEKDITFNQMCEEILRDSLSRMKDTLEDLDD